MARFKARRKTKAAQAKTNGQANRNDEGYDYELRHRRSSMRVNLSFVSNLSDAEQTSPQRLSSCKADVNELTKVQESNENVDIVASEQQPIEEDGLALTGETRNNTLNSIEQKELQLNRSCMQLKDAIMSKTRALFDKDNDLARRTSEILTGHASPELQQLDELHDKRTPSVRVDIGKNQQIVMSGDGREKNPVQVNSMLKSRLMENRASSSQNSNEDAMDGNQSIVSTPKKSRIDISASKDKISDKANETAIKIPVARLFADNDPNNSMSESNLIWIVNNSVTPCVNNIKLSKFDQGSNSNQTNKVVYTSPILSQGNRRSRFSRLSLKKKLTKTITEESFMNRPPLVSSSFIDKQKETSVSNDTDKNCNTINLDDTKNNSKTIDIQDSETKSSMEITTISSHMPIIRRSFQNIIRTSLKLDNLNTNNKDISSFPTTTQVQVNINRNDNRENSELQQNEKSQNNISCQEDCSISTVRTSLNVNTSLDKINSADSISQKENKTPNNSNNVSPKNQENSEIIPHQSTFIVPAPKKKSFTRKSKRKSLLTKNKHQMRKRSDTTVSESLEVSNNQEEENNVTVISQQPKVNTIKKKEYCHIDQENISNEKEKNSLEKQKESLNCNKKKEENKIVSQQSSIGTARFSMQVNTSLDSIRKSSEKHVIDFKMLTMLEESTVDKNKSNESHSSYTSDDEDSDSDSEAENVSLMKRLKNMSRLKNPEGNKKVNKLRKSSGFQNNRSKKRKSIKDKNSSSSKKSSTIDEDDLSNAKKSIGTNNKSSKLRKSIRTDVSTASNESGIVESTPYPISRSVLLKTILQNNIAMNTLDPRKFLDLSDNEDSSNELQTGIHENARPLTNKSKSVYSRKKTQSPKLLDTVVLNSSDESTDPVSESEAEKERVIIEESINITKHLDNSKNDLKSDNEQKNGKTITKRKLYMLRENSQISLSPSEFQEMPEEEEPVIKRKKRKRLQAELKKAEEKPPLLSPELGNECEPEQNEIPPALVERKNRKPRKILRKKIVVKKLPDRCMLDNMVAKQNIPAQRSNERNSLREFDLRKIGQNENTRKNHRIVIVVTGLPRGDKDLVKSVVKGLGSAILEVNVTPRTTHVISSGVRTINLLRGILRGCWLLSLEWALKSLESGKWLDPSPYEMSHFAKAVQENRRDRQLFGKGYVPELFVTCGLIYIETGTSPPAPVLKELVKIAGGRITEDPGQAHIEIGSEGLKEIWILDSITTGEIQSIENYKRN